MWTLGGLAGGAAREGLVSSRVASSATRCSSVNFDPGGNAEHRRIEHRTFRVPLWKCNRLRKAGSSIHSGKSWVACKGNV